MPASDLAAAIAAAPPPQPQPFLPFVQPSDVLARYGGDLRPSPKRPPRPKLFHAADEDAASVVRGVMIDALDRAYCDGKLGELLWRDSGNEDLREKGEDVFQEIQRLLFPEEFDRDGGNARAVAAYMAGREPDSLVPVGGPKRAGADRLAVLLTDADRKELARRRAKRATLRAMG